MCGIAGCFMPHVTREQLIGDVTSMGETLKHRGPDNGGIWVDEAVGIALAHQRLSIIGISDLGNQPMFSSCSRYVIVFNGEIYNFSEIHADLDKSGLLPVLRGSSDTEILLAAIVVWGLELTLQRCTGMFAFALWDRQEQSLCLARDRFGEKPLYYGRVGSTFLFGSELKALCAHPGFRASIDREALAMFMRYSYISAPESIYNDIHKLHPGYILRADLVGGNDSLIPFWSSAKRVISCHNKLLGDEKDVLVGLDDLLGTVVAKQMVADVPIGAFLSGGVDSSLIVALMQQHSTKPVNTFSIGFSEPLYDESTYARAVAEHLGTKHTELIVSSSELLEVVPNLPLLYDEPFGDSSQVPTFLVSQLASKHVTVALSGDGGDEVFGGYNRHRWADGAWKSISSLPMPLRDVLREMLLVLSPNSWNKVYSLLEGVIPDRYHMRLAGGKMHKIAHSLSAKNIGDLYRQLTAVWSDAGSVVIGSVGSELEVTIPAGLSEVEKMMFLDLKKYLPGDILTKVDRAAMGVGLETRIPFLDHNVVEFAWSMPLNMKLKDGQGKWALRQLLERYIPVNLIDRPKMGFGVPIDSWLRGPLRDWAGDLLSEDGLRRGGYLVPEVVQKLWNEHQSGRYDRHHQLWNVLMFQAWLAEQ